MTVVRSAADDGPGAATNPPEGKPSSWLTSRWDAARLDALVARLEASAAIARLSSGSAGTIGTYLPGRRIPGVRVRDDGRVDIHVVMARDATVDEVEAAVIRAMDGAPPPDLYIDDMDAYEQVG
jgi:hypothetical protein